MAELNKLEGCADVDDTKLDSDDKIDILEALTDVNARYYEIGTMLHLKTNTLDGFKNNRTTDAIAMSSVVVEWLKEMYKTDRFGPPTWKRLVEVIASQNGGNNRNLAKKVAGDHKKKCLASVTEKQKRVPKSLERPARNTLQNSKPTANHGASVRTVSAAVPSGSNYTPKLDTKTTEVDTGVFEDLSITPENGAGDYLDNDNEEQHTHCQEQVLLPQPILPFNENGNAECVVSNKSASGVEQSDDQEKDSNMTTGVQDSSGSSLASTVHQQQLNYPSEAGFAKINYLVAEEQKKSEENDKIIADLCRKLAEHETDKQKLTKSIANKEKALAEEISKSDELIKKYTHHIKMLQQENKLELEKMEREVQELKKKVEEQDKQLKRAEMEKENLSLETANMQKKHDEEIAQLKRKIENAEHEKERLRKDLEHQKQKGECDMKVQKAELEKEALREKNEQEKEYLREKNEQEKEYLREKNEQDKEYLREKNEQEKDYLREKHEQEKEYLREKNEQEKDYLREKSEQEKEYLREKNEQEKEYLREKNEQEKNEQEKEILQQKIKGLEEVACAISSGSNDTQTEIAIDLQKMNISDQDDQLAISD